MPGPRRDIWQARFYDKVLRIDATIGAVRRYIWENPANWQKDQENLHRFSVET